jgi:hypothetical protein
MGKKLKSNLDIKKLVQITIRTILKYNVNLDQEPLKRPKNLNDPTILDVWNKISYEFFKTIEYKNTLNIFSWWHRNTNKYASIVRAKMKEFEEDTAMEWEPSEEISKNEIKIQLSDQDIEKLESFVRQYQLRFRFDTKFDNFLSERLQQYGIKCWLRSKSNWFKKQSSQKISAPYWRGLFSCSESKCTNTFKAYIKNELKKNSSIIFSRKINQAENCIYVCLDKASNNHDLIIPKVRCSGKERSEQELEILAKGVTNVVIDNSIHNDEKEFFLGKINQIYSI